MVELQALREWLELAEDFVEDDSLILQLETAAVAYIERETGYFYSIADTYTEYVTGDGTSTLYLSRNLSADPTTLLEVAEVGDAGEAITSAQADGWVRRGNKLVRKAGGVWTKNYEYAVTYSAGYELGAEPADVAQCVKELVELAYNSRGRPGLSSETVGPNYSWTRADIDEQLTPIAQGVLNFKKPVLA